MLNPAGRKMEVYQERVVQKKKGDKSCKRHPGHSRGLSYTNVSACCIVVVGRTA